MLPIMSFSPATLLTFIAIDQVFLKILFIFIFFKYLLNLLQYCFCSTFWFFGRKSYGILAPQPGTEPASPALEGKVLTTGPPGKSRHRLVLPAFELHINGLTQCVLSCVWLLSLNTRSVQFFHVVECIRSLFLFIAEYYSIVWMYQRRLIHSPVEGYLGWFQSGGNYE